MNSPPSSPRYNHRIPQMRARTSSSLRPGWLTSFLLAAFFLPATLQASNLADTARQLAHKIAADAGPGTIALEVTNRSSLDQKAMDEIRSTLEAQLLAEGVHAAKPEQSMGTVSVTLSESLREYVWTAVIVIGTDEKKIALVWLPRPSTEKPFAAAPAIALKATRMFAQQQPILDIALIDVAGGFRPVVLSDGVVSVYRQQGPNPSGRWELESAFPIAHARPFPRDLRGRLLLRRDHLFDIYLPGTFCRSSGVAPLTITCRDTDDPWPLTPNEDGVRAFFAGSRNFFTGALSPGIGKVSTVPSFYSAAVLPRSNYTLWAIAAVDGSLHLVDGMTDQLVRGTKWGSDLAAVHSGCGSGTQLLVSDGSTLASVNSERDALRAFEVPDRDPLPVSAALEFEGQVVTLWPETNGNSATTIVKRRDTGWYEAYRISISCAN
jgi:hypothetical protein